MIKFNEQVYFSFQYIRRAPNKEKSKELGEIDYKSYIDSLKSFTVDLNKQQYYDFEATFNRFEMTNNIIPSFNDTNVNSTYLTISKKDGMSFDQWWVSKTELTHYLTLTITRNRY